MKELRFMVLHEKIKEYVSPRDLDLAVDIGLPDDEPSFFRGIDER